MRSPASTARVHSYADASISAWTKPASIAATAPPSSSIRAISSQRARLELVGQRLDVVGAAERIGGVGDPGLVREDLLRAQRDRRGPLDGSASASSKEFVCSDCAPPQTADSAWIATRTTLFSGCCAVSVEPPVCAWKRSASAFGFVDAEALAASARAQSRRAARNFATSWKKSLCALKKNDSRSPNSSGESPASIAASQ